MAGRSRTPAVTAAAGAGRAHGRPAGTPSHTLADRRTRVPSYSSTAWMTAAPGSTTSLSSASSSSMRLPTDRRASTAPPARDPPWRPPAAATTDLVSGVAAEDEVEDEDEEGPMDGWVPSESLCDLPHVDDVNGDLWEQLQRRSADADAHVAIAVDAASAAHGRDAKAADEDNDPFPNTAMAAITASVSRWLAWTTQIASSAMWDRSVDFAGHPGGGGAPSRYRPHYDADDEEADEADSDEVGGFDMGESSGMAARSPDGDGGHANEPGFTADSGPVPEYCGLQAFQYAFPRLVLFCVLSVVSCGVLPVACRWRPDWMTRLARRRTRSFRDADVLLLETRRRRLVETPVLRQTLDDGSAMVWFEFKKRRYIWDDQHQGFRVRIPKLALSELDWTRTYGLTAQEVCAARQRYGPNTIDIGAPRLASRVADKLAHPFYLFQAISILIWLMDDYVEYALVILAASAASVAWETYGEAQAAANLRTLAQLHTAVCVIRDGVRQTIPNAELVVGDLVCLQGARPVVADILLLAGAAVVNESTVTGEAVPVNKQPLDRATAAPLVDARRRAVASRDRAALDGLQESEAALTRRHFLLCGSQILTCMAGATSEMTTTSSPLTADSHADAGSDAESADECRGLVVTTGFASTKGELFRSILYPKDMPIRFQRDAWFFMMGLSLVGLLLFIHRLVQGLRAGHAFGRVLLSSADLITIAIPPALPLVLTIGVALATKQLAQSRIVCIDAPRIHFAGRIDVMCWDKTGTLTTPALQLVQIVDPQAPAARSATSATASVPPSASSSATPRGSVPSPAATPPHDSAAAATAASPAAPATLSAFTRDSPLEWIAGCCHDLALVGGDVVGNFVDVELFRKAGWRLLAHNHVAPPGFDGARWADDGGGGHGSGGGITPDSDGAGEGQPLILKSGAVSAESGADALPRLEIPQAAPPPSVSAPASSRDAAWTDASRMVLSPLKLSPTKPQPVETWTVVHVFPFEPRLQRSCVVARHDPTDTHYVLMKGAYEVVSRFCHGSTLPPRAHTPFGRQGMYVLAAAWAPLPPHLFADASPTSAGTAATAMATASHRRLVHPLPRPQLEGNLNFAGFFLLRGPLKPEAPRVIQTLREAGIENTIITGDDVYTAIWTARQLGLDASIVLLDTVRGELAFTAVPYSQYQNDVKQQQQQQQQRYLESPSAYEEDQAMPERWRAFEDIKQFLHDHAPDAVFAMTSRGLTALLKEPNASLVSWFMLRTRIYARMSPWQKSHIVERLIEAGKHVGMCGDGTNDCGALKAAHMGIALSTTDASIVAPFTSSDRHLQDVVTLVTSGRAALETSFVAFRFMALYPMIQVVLSATLLQMGTAIAPHQYLFDDMVLILGVSFFMMAAPPATTLGRVRPPDTLFHPSILASLGGHWLICLLFFLMVVGFLKYQYWYCAAIDALAPLTAAFVPRDPALPDVVNYPCYPISVVTDTLGDKLLRTYENTVLWLFTHFQFVFIALALNFAPKYRKPLYAQGAFVLVISLMFALLSLMLLYDDEATDGGHGPHAAPRGVLFRGYGLREGVPWAFRFALWMVAVANAAFLLLWESVGVQAILSHWVARADDLRARGVAQHLDRQAGIRDYVRVHAGHGAAFLNSFVMAPGRRLVDTVSAAWAASSPRLSKLNLFASSGASGVRGGGGGGGGSGSSNGLAHGGARGGGSGDPEHGMLMLGPLSPRGAPTMTGASTPRGLGGWPTRLGRHFSMDSSVDDDSLARAPRFPSGRAVRPLGMTDRTAAGAAGVHPGIERAGSPFILRGAQQHHFMTSASVTSVAGGSVWQGDGDSDAGHNDAASVTTTVTTPFLDARAP